jgi:amylosucrase
MVQFWSALATRDTRLMAHVLRSHFPPVAEQRDLRHLPALPRRHRLGRHRRGCRRRRAFGPAHRAFLSAFYEGGFPGSFATGALFQVNEATGDRRISGSCASLAGLERAMAAGDAARPRWR